MKASLYLALAVAAVGRCQSTPGSYGSADTAMSSNAGSATSTMDNYSASDSSTDSPSMSITAAADKSSSGAPMMSSPSMTGTDSIVTVTQYTDSCVVPTDTWTATTTIGITETYCDMCTGGPHPPTSVPGLSTTYTVTWVDVCPTGTTNVPYTITEACTATGQPVSSGHVPAGYTVTTKMCDMCATPGPLVCTTPMVTPSAAPPAPPPPAGSAPPASAPPASVQTPATAAPPATNYGNNATNPAACPGCGSAPSSPSSSPITPASGAGALSFSLQSLTALIGFVAVFFLAL